MKKTPTSTKDSLPNKEMNDLPRLASAVLPLCSQHPGQCGLFPLEKSLDAFAARYRLAEMAEHTLDVQYYIWQDDMSGRLLFSALLAAAKRGVRVRCCWTTTIRPDLTTFYACLTVIHALKSGFLILSRFACCVRLVISPTFPVLIAVCTIKVSLSMAW